MATGRNFLGPYQLIKLIRAGTTTQVWEAIKSGQQTERVALKVLHESHRKDKTEIAYLKHETLVGKELDHENVIKIYEYLEAGGFPMIAMQLFNAKNLKIEIRENPEFVAANTPVIIRKCAEGLQHLHSHGWVHCDIKPDNFLADEQANVKVIDFSIAEKIKKGFSFGFGSKVIRGTRSYMAPEQIRKKKLDERTDIYGFGCVIFEMLSGRAPFTANNPDELLQKHLRARPPSLQALSGATEQLAKLVYRMLEKDPDKRPQSMIEFLGEFQNLSVFRAGHRPTGLQR